MEIKDKDLKIKIIRTNPDEYISLLIETAVQIEHLPTGIIVQSIATQAHCKPSNHEKRIECMNILKEKLQEL